MYSDKIPRTVNTKTYTVFTIEGSSIERKRHEREKGYRGNNWILGSYIQINFVETFNFHLINIGQVWKWKTRWERWNRTCHVQVNAPLQAGACHVKFFRCYTSICMRLTSW